MLKLHKYDLIVRPIFTEKSMTPLDVRATNADSIKSEHKKYHFMVDRSACKDKVKDIVQSVFSVEVDKVNILNVKGKTKFKGGKMSRRSDEKKAIVTLKSGHSISYE